VNTISFELTDEGRFTLEKGSPEILLLAALNSGEMTVDEMKKNHKIAMGFAMKNKWIKIDGPIAKATTESAKDAIVDLLKLVANSDGAEDSISASDAKMLKKRNQIIQIKTVNFNCSKGLKWALQRVKLEQVLTKEMIETGSWKDMSFKPTNFRSTGTNVNGGFLHPLMLVRAEYRKILIGMGFEEMPTNKWVESSFWNFDSLFQPQQHPARDAHDTFFIKTPQFASLEAVTPGLVETVKQMHEVGGHGSRGYRYKWSLEEAKKNILRTHTTAISSQMLHRLATQPGGFKPAKYFSIDRVFRNEVVDATHLAEFHQVELLAADYNLSLGDLIGMIKTFFMSVGITDVRFKPAYNPYTEPSMEIFGYHPDLKKWTEIGNSGMFRPEMVRPLGLPEGVRVIACGLSLERPTMIKYRVKKIKELFGHKINLESTRNSQFPLFKEA